MEKRAVRRDAFIVRIWRDAYVGQSGWKGRIQHVSTGESALVQSTDELLAFVERRTGKLNNTPWRGLK